MNYGAGGLSDWQVANAGHIKKLAACSESIRAAKAAHETTLEEGAKASIAQQRLAMEQIASLKGQNKKLSDNYDKLEAMFDVQCKVLEESREDVRRSRRFNGWMMVIAAVSMLAAIAGPIVTICISR